MPSPPRGAAGPTPATPPCFSLPARAPRRGGAGGPAPLRSLATLPGGPRVIVSTAPFIAGHRVVETKGQTFGLVVRSRGFSGNLIAGLRSPGGGAVHEG